MRNPNVKCIPLVAAEELKKALKDGEINIGSLYKMTTKERKDVFNKYASEELSTQINTAFEKAIVSKQKASLKEWAEKTFTPEEKKSGNYQDVIKKINDLDNLGILNPEKSGYFNDLVADKLGISISAEEMTNIRNKAESLQNTFEVKNDFGLPEVGYWKARKEMDDYISSLNPSHALKVTTSISGRGAMLASVKSPMTNIISNTVQGVVQAFERRLSGGQYQGKNSDFAIEYVKYVNEVYQASGYDISRMDNLSIGEKRLGEDVISAKGKGIQRKIGQWYEDVVFKQLMGAPDVAFSSVAFADSANLSSTKLANGNQAKALEIFKDATSIEPKTIEGEAVRSQAIADAKYATYTNRGGYSDLAMGIRNVLNNATGDVRLGDQLMPFVKTPANVVEAGIEAAGVGFIKAGIKLPEAWKEMKLGNGEPMKEVVRYATRSGLGLTLATVLAYMINPDDFIGEYDGMLQKGRDVAKAKNAPYNSIKVGNKYISLDYFGPIAASFTGIMYARKYGTDIPTSAYQYAKGVAGQALKVPGLREFSDLVKNVNDAIQRGDIKKTTEGLGDEVVAYIRARTIPALVSDIAQGIDPVQRETGKSSVSKAQSSIPVVRQQLPEKVSSVTGEAMKSEGIVSTLLFGSRVKTATDSPLVKEVDRLYKQDEAPTISSIDRASKRVKELEKQIPKEEFNKALKYFGKTYNDNATSKIVSNAYRNMTDEDRKKELNNIREEAVTRMLNKYGYKRPRNEKKLKDLLE